MRTPGYDDNSLRTSDASFPPALLYMLATGLLMLMSFALEPMLALPLAAFLAMVALTFRLGRRVQAELNYAAGRRTALNLDPAEIAD